MKSVKKTFANSLSIRFTGACVNDYVFKFNNRFIAHRYDNTNTAQNYVLGLLKCPKGQANMERMEEEIPESEYRAYQQFISNSNWDCEGLQEDVALECSAVLSAQKQKNKKPIGYIIDESAHLKKGNMSVAVSRQYAGVAGKVENCQVGVYSSLANDKYASIINQRLFVPKSWSEDSKRCEKAGIPQEYQKYKTKPELALEMIKQDIERGVKFDWIGGDGLYGHSSELCDGLDELGQFFVLDVHKDETVYLEEPSFSVPKAKSGRGRKPIKLKANQKAIRLDKLLYQIQDNEWQLEEIRDTTKGKLRLYVFKKQVWIWNGKDEKAKRRVLIITKTTGKNPKIKYSISNGELNQYNHQEYAYFVAQRYWVERTFDNAKNELGMSDYQTRKWKAWHHHHALIMLTSLFIMQQMIDNQSEIPLLSFRDARILMILAIFGTKKELKLGIEQMKKRHKKRKYDIDRNYRKQTENQRKLTS